VALFSASIRISEVYRLTRWRLIPRTAPIPGTASPSVRPLRSAITTVSLGELYSIPVNDDAIFPGPGLRTVNFIWFNQISIRWVRNRHQETALTGCRHSSGYACFNEWCRWLERDRQFGRTISSVGGCIGLCKMHDLVRSFF